MYQNTKEQLKKLKNTNSRINPDRSWVMENKEKMLCQISNNTSDQKNTFNFSYIWDMVNVIMPGQMVYSVVRPVLVFLLIGAVATSGWIASVGATANSLPGDLGYGVKLATEKTQEIVASVTSSGDKEAQLHMEFASRRSQEVKKVVENKVAENNSAETSKKVEDTIKRLEQSIDSANDKIKEVSENQPEKIVETSKAVAEKTKEINNNLKDAGKEVGDAGITEAKKKVAEIGLNAVEAVVKVKEEGSAVVSDEEVRDLVNDQIENILADVDEIKTQAEEAAKGLDDVNTSEGGNTGINIDSVLMPTSTTKSDPTTKTNSSTVKIDTVTTSTSSLADVKTAVGEAIKKVNETGVTSVKDLADAKTLVENNHITEAIERVRQITGTTQATEKVVTEVKKVVSSVVTQEIIKQEVAKEVIVEKDLNPKSPEVSTSSVDVTGVEKVIGDIE